MESFVVDPEPDIECRNRFKEILSEQESNKDLFRSSVRRRLHEVANSFISRINQMEHIYGVAITEAPIADEELEEFLALQRASVNHILFILREYEEGYQAYREQIKIEEAARRFEEFLSQVPKHPTPLKRDLLCAKCRKRERHFNEYCKRCVPEELRPKGKV